MSIHQSDCSLHNEPAYENGDCDCGAEPLTAKAVIASLERMLVRLETFPDLLPGSPIIARIGRDAGWLKVGECRAYLKTSADSIRATIAKIAAVYEEEPTHEN